MKLTGFVLLTITSSILVVLSSHSVSLVMALAPPEDTPEEVLRTQIITAARSPIDGKLLTAAEYAKMQTKLQTSPTPKLSPQVRQNVFLIRLRKLVLQLFPFLDI
ncbi:MAG: hypothetical protein QNJ47_24640 [Nostocaceae cyanobacterium]|nr:hypothetical protein [Nostocaceae cyanobacterium]